jgi:murein endopeptidase
VRKAKGDEGAAVGARASQGQPPRIDAQLRESGQGFYTYGDRTGQYGTTGTIDSIEQWGRDWLEPGPQRSRIGVGDISLEGGGLFSPHSSHQRGLDVDIRPMRNDAVEGPVSIGSPRYDRNATDSLIRTIQRDPRVERILFNDSQIEGVRPWPGHDNHIHIRLRP